MVFNSLEFAVFMVAVYGLYLVLGHRMQNRMLLVASYLFYGAWDERFLLLIAVSTVIDYIVARKIEASDDASTRKRLVTMSLISNLGILGVFKYFDFFSRSFADLALNWFDWQVDPLLLDIVLPVGISFYTFQTLSYTIDVYRGTLKATDNFFDFALFVAFFPQLVAGPIERASRLLPQILERRDVTWGGFGSGGWLILSGLVKKAIVADNLGAVVDIVYGAPTEATSVEILLATYAFAWQIYCDFSGYTDIARGVARIMGFELMLNFRLPYVAKNPSDFWRRWHISLSTWLRDYLYISLGGNRGGAWMTYRNLALTMLLGGLWHGAAWTFVIWGAYQGALLIGHRLAEPSLERIAPSKDSRAWDVVRVVVMFHLACLGWMIFRADDVASLGQLFSGLFGPLEVGRVALWWKPFVTLVVPLGAYQLLQAWKDDLAVALRWPVPVRAVFYAALVFALILLGEDFGGQFIYFQF